jgi:hypothetical protein
MAGGGKGGGGGTKSEKTELANPITYWREMVGTYPGNNIIWWAYKRPIEVGSSEPPKYYLEVFDPGMRHQISAGNTPVGRGHFIYNAFHIDRSSVSGVPNIPVQSAGPSRPKCIAFFAGRVFYAGVKATKFASNIYFCQIIERDSQIALCHQQQDPSEEDAPDLLPSDGGVIVVPEIAEVIKLFSKGASLLVFATNGVWNISGSEGIGFKANDYSVTKISDTPALSESSFVSVDGNPVWWNRSGIWTVVSKSPIEHEVQSLTNQTIQEYYIAIPDESKKWAKGAYNHQTKIVQWLYAEEAPEDENDYNVYDTILNFNTLTGAFYPWTVPVHDRVQLRGIFAVEGNTIVQTIEQVMVGDEQVMVGDEEVVAVVSRQASVDSKFKYIINVVEDVGDLPEVEE